jgi:hypothetical protein
MLAVVTVLLLFLPFMSDISYPAEETSRVVLEVMGTSFASRVAPVLPLAKLALLAVAASPFLARRDVARVVLGYYGVVLVPIGFFQNMSVLTTYGFVWMYGNTLVDLLVASRCAIDLVQGRTRVDGTRLRRARLWLLVPMALALLGPYAADAAGNVVPDFGRALLASDSGVTYCMVTPVVLGTLLLFPDGVDEDTLSYLAFVGLAFGAMNLLTCFVMVPASWWMGVLHLPLVLTSVLGLVEARRKRAAAQGPQPAGADGATQAA